MRRPWLRTGRLFLPALLLSLAQAAAGPAQVRVVNMIPNSLSEETQRDSEPNIAVNPANPMQIAATAITPDPLNSGSGPIFVSTDGGETWTLNVVLPGGTVAGDRTIRFGGTSSVLYGAIIRHDTVTRDTNLLRTSNFLAPGLMDILVDRPGLDDQPYVQAATVLGPVDTGKDRVYVGSNDTNAPGGQTATVDVSLDAATAPPPAGFFPTRLDPRATTGQDGPPIRPAIHPNGTIYAAYLNTGNDLVVARDNNWASGLNPFTDLLDPKDTKAGCRVATGLSIPFLLLLGTQRVGGQLSIAVDPTNSNTVYLAWGDGTSGSTATLHLRRSLDAGKTWSGDLRTIATATNPALAVNIRGKVGFLYQQLGNPGTGNRWRTHLERSADGFATPPVDLLLADVPDSNGSYMGDNPIGDFLHLQAIGKNFYGVFSANNTPDPANFPNGVVYLRNADFTTKKLRNLANTADVDPSIDPFFFSVTEQAAADDFYVRDWTDNPTSGDTGLEPSTHAVFYTTSDVWNRRGTLPGSFPNDQPDSEPAGNGSGILGDNWAFARIRRNATSPRTGSKTVTAHFLVSKFGIGSNFEDGSSGDPDLSFPDPDPTVTFKAANVGPITTAAYHWHLNLISSTHLCLAVEISAPGDPYVPPSLLGRAPGWPTTDLSVLYDNNKAQRNLTLSTTPARGPGMDDSFCALVHNAATYPRQVRLRLKASPEVLRRLPGAHVEVVGGRGKRIGPLDTLTLENMLPGENRWVCLTFPAPKGEPGEILPIYFFEEVGNTVVNGFAIAAQPAPMPRVIPRNLELHRSAFTRLAAGFGVEEAMKEAEVALRLLKKKEVSDKEYAEFLRAQLPAVSRFLDDLIKAQRAGDPFVLAAALKTLRTSLDGGDAEPAAVAHTALLNKLDAFLTMRQLAQGDPADILQNVRWQKDLYTRVPQLRRLALTRHLLDESQKWIVAYGARKARANDYPRLVKDLLGAFRATAQALRTANLHLEADIAEMEKHLDSVTALQKAHRDYLLKLQTLPTGPGL